MKPPVDKVGLALIRDGHLLLARNHAADKFQIPGGKVEAHDKDDISALLREIQEELQVMLSPCSISYAGVFSDKAEGQSGRLVNVKLFISYADLKPVAANEIAELRWIALSGRQPPANASAVVRQQIIPYLQTVYQHR